jgi:hypothetical protein
MSQFVIGNAETDGTAFTVPGEKPGTPESYEVDNADNADTYKWYVHIDNGYDVDVDVTIQGSHYQDSSLTSAAADGATETISSGGVDFFDGTTLHSFIELEVDPLSDPTSGDLTVTFQRRRA